MVKNNKRDYGIYQVAMKILLKRGDEYLFVLDSSGNRYDLPGGRADDNEYEIPLQKILEREVREELGRTLKCRLGKPIYQFRRHLKNKNRYVFITVYEAKYLSGRIKLSPEHTEYKWINLKSFKFKEKNFWSREEYSVSVNYFKNNL